MKRILVIGDSIIDRYWYCTPKRISPEAPILCWDTDKIKDSPGGAANVANNIYSLIQIFQSDIKMSFVSIAPKGFIDILPVGFPTEGIFTSSYMGTIKNRIVYDSPYQQILRFDQDNNSPPTSEEKNFLLERIGKERFDIGVISDYSHGGVDWELAREVKQHCETVIVDPKGTNCHKYAGMVDIITPNLEELADLTDKNLPFDHQLRELRTNIEACSGRYPEILLKRGEKGFILFPNKGLKAIDYPAYKSGRPFIDPTGAGDTFIATLAFCLARDFNLVEAAKEANRLAGISVTFPKCWVPEKGYI